MKLIEYVRTLLQSCPLLAGDRINADFLDAEHGSYSVDTSPAEPIVQRYVNGDSRRQFVFTFCSNEFYGEEIRQNLDNIGFWEDFADWLEHVPLPDTLGDDKTPQSIEILASGYAFMTEADAARYQIECRLLYRQKGN
jgi:hypothetical protein